MLSPAALSILMSTFREGTPRAHALAAWGAVGGAGAAVGVLLGGALTELVGWQAIFLINVPVGLGLAVAAQRIIARRRSRTALERIRPPRRRCSPRPASGRSSTRSRRPPTPAGPRRGPRRGRSGRRRPDRVRDRRAPRHPSPASHRPPRRPRRGRRIPHDARGRGSAVRAVPAVVAVPAERAGSRSAGRPASSFLPLAIALAAGVHVGSHVDDARRRPRADGGGLRRRRRRDAAALRRRRRRQLPRRPPPRHARRRPRTRPRARVGVRVGDDGRRGRRDRNAVRAQHDRPRDRRVDRHRGRGDDRRRLSRPERAWPGRATASATPSWRSPGSPCWPASPPSS